MINIDTKMIVEKLISTIRSLLEKGEYKEVDSLISSDDVLHSLPMWITLGDDFMEPYCISLEDEARGPFLPNDNIGKVVKFYRLFDKYCVYLKVCGIFRLTSSLHSLSNTRWHLENLKSDIFRGFPELPLEYVRKDGKFAVEHLPF